MKKEQIIKELKKLTQEFHNELDSNYEIKLGVKNHYETNNLRQIQNKIRTFTNMLKQEK